MAEPHGTADTEAKQCRGCQAVCLGRDAYLDHECDLSRESRATDVNTSSNPEDSSEDDDITDTADTTSSETTTTEDADKRPDSAPQLTFERQPLPTLHPDYVEMRDRYLTANTPPLMGPGIIWPAANVQAPPLRRARYVDFHDCYPPQQQQCRQEQPMVNIPILQPSTMTRGPPPVLPPPYLSHLPANEGELPPAPAPQQLPTQLQPGDPLITVRTLQEVGQQIDEMEAAFTTSAESAREMRALVRCLNEVLARSAMPRYYKPC